MGRNDVIEAEDSLRRGNCTPGDFALLLPDFVAFFDVFAILGTLWAGGRTPDTTTDGHRVRPPSTVSEPPVLVDNVRPCRSEPPSIRPLVSPPWMPRHAAWLGIEEGLLVGPPDRFEALG